jgi:acylphosphatase
MVQGVGFRYTARNSARRYRITGFVKNLPDGRVELLVEGERQEALAFLADLEQEMRGYIEEAEKTVDPATNEFASFTIRF